MNIQVGLKIYLCLLATCTFKFRQVCIIESLFIKTTSGMHRPFEGRHLVLFNGNVLSLSLMIQIFTGKEVQFEEVQFTHDLQQGEFHLKTFLCLPSSVMGEVYCFPRC